MRATTSSFLHKAGWAALLSVGYTLMMAFILYGSWRYRIDHTIFDLCYAFVYFLLLYEGYEWLVRRFDLRIHHQQIKITPKKLLLAMGSFCLYSWLLIIVVAIIPFLLFMGGHVAPVEGSQEFRMNFVINFIFALAYFSVLTAYRIEKQFQLSKIEAQKLERERMLAQMETLKNQVSPHFLFNSLNALSNLIQTQPETASRFVDELSEIFRYSMQYQHHDLVPLKDELHFAEAFFFLLKIRFRERLQLELKVDESLHQKMLPPLSLQLLIENAIKHNIVSKDDPLSIRLYAEGDYLWVENKLQKRDAAGESTGVGLQNIKNRYQYLSDAQVQIVASHTHFKVGIPLLSEATA
ncbi:MAG: sensor histidine kinase [Bacteroidia bacterium]